MFWRGIHDSAKHRQCQIRFVYTFFLAVHANKIGLKVLIVVLLNNYIRSNNNKYFQTKNYEIKTLIYHLEKIAEGASHLALGCFRGSQSREYAPMAHTFFSLHPHMQQ